MKPERQLDEYESEVLTAYEAGELALREGIPYQTLIASILHKYVTGRLVERG